MKYKAYYLLILILFTYVLGVFAQKIGTASFYGKRLHGRHTNSGEKLDNSSFTAAHKTLPFGTLVRVTNLKNNKSVVVKINDRGRFKRGRVIDLTYAAAKEIDMLRDGIANVQLDVLPSDSIMVVPDSLDAYNNVAKKKVASLF
ncbi:MAG: septal ring lytic transglycosylase RlpA family protein [Paludibacteraceae bacterium]|nr:septal ring lytic transglycosylase RlpA family protein [Paludibacteraceae bacterium]